MRFDFLLFPLPSSKSSFSISWLLYSHYRSFLTSLLPFSVYYLICSPHYSTIKLSEEIIITLNTKTFAHKIKARSCFYLAPASSCICLILDHVNCTLLTLPQLWLSSSYMCCDLSLCFFFYKHAVHPVMHMITLEKGTSALFHPLSVDEYYSHALFHWSFQWNYKLLKGRDHFFYKIVIYKAASLMPSIHMGSKLVSMKKQLQGVYTLDL